MKEMEKLVSDLAEDCRVNGKDTFKKVASHIFNILWKDYKGKPGAVRCRVSHVADDLAESVCLRLGIPQA